MDDFERKQDENREWSDEEFYQKEVDNNRLQEDAVGSDDELYKNYKDDGVTNQDENIHDLPSRVKCSTPKAQDSSSDDDIPIAMMITRCISKKKEKEPVRRKLIDDDIDEEDDLMDDNSLDKSYDPSKDDCNSTDSEAVEIKKSRKKKRKRSKQDEASSNRTKNLKLKLRQSIKVLQNSRKRQNRMAESNSCTVGRALHISKKMQSLKNHIRDIHYARLINLLAYNERKLVKVNADGNCFFAAVAACIEDYTFDDLTEFRQSLCDFMLQKKENYIQFMAFDSDSCNQQEIFVNEVNYLRQSGQWNTHLADCLPLAIADKFNRIVRIYSSSVSSPIINIKPSSWSESESYKLIEAAHVAIRQKEHYEGTASITQQIQTDSHINRQRGLSSPEKNNDTNTPDTTIITPHKRADYETPVKKKSSRKRVRNECQWKSSKRKRNKNEGKSYVSQSGKAVKGKQVQPQNCEKCRFKCNQHVSEIERKKIFDMYYSLPNYERQRCFICDVVTQSTPIRKKTGKKQKSLQYHLPVNNENVRVCANFFRKTLDIGHKVVRYTLARKIHGTFQGEDRRGRNQPSTKIDEETIDFVIKHINSFPRMESHYSRKGTKKEYLAHDLNIKKMWELYTDWCRHKGITPVKEGKYRSVFCEKFNLSFFKPKKDQCSTCAKYQRYQNAGTVTDDIQDEYDKHQTSKTQAREEKEKDKQKAKLDLKYCVATFDLQAVLTTPCSLVSELYYSRKLCCYNLTVYNYNRYFVIYGMKHMEKKGSCEIATCLLKSSQSFCQSGGVEEITYYSDTCGGQNRNKYVAASYMYCISKLPQLKAINHKFLQSGHSQMECDSVHSTIEQAKKSTSIYVPSNWSTVINMARRKSPYIAVPLKSDHEMDFKSLVTKHHLNLHTTTEGCRVNWLNIKWIRINREEPKVLLINYSFDENSFMKVNTVQRETRKKGRVNTWPINDSEIDKCYLTRLPVSEQKKKDLVNLCKKEIIPSDFHSYYTNLPTAKHCKDKIPSSSEDEDLDTLLSNNKPFPMKVRISYMCIEHVLTQMICNNALIFA